jgi:exosortase/archaeosortase family protein
MTIAVRRLAMASGEARLERLRAAARRSRPALPGLIVVLAALAGYHYTLSSMADYLRLETPLAYLPLLPLFAGALAISTWRRHREAPVPARDLMIDLLVGIPLLLVALALITLLPAAASTYYWTDRADVLSFACFIAGGVIVGYGLGWFWRLRTAMLFLVLMWPALYLHVMSGLMQSFSDATNAALAVIVSHLSLGIQLLDAHAGTISIPQGSGAPLLVSVGSACSGANSVLGFFLVGGALMTTQTGGLARKLLWLASGLVLCFALNIVRLLSIFGLARAGHPQLALGGYHAIAGLVLFSLAVLIMVALQPRFGLHPRPLAESTEATARPLRLPRRLYRVVAAMLAAVFVLLVFAADSQLAPYAAFADGTGAPTVHPFAQGPYPRSWMVSTSPAQDYTWARQYFGDNSSFIRYDIAGGATGLIFADVVLTDDKGSLDAYNLESCFLFHNYRITTSKRIDLGRGVTGLLINYSDPTSNAHWATVSWAWPVRYRSTTYYERIVLTSSPLGGSVTPPNTAPSTGLRGAVLDVLNGIGGSQAAADDSATYGRVDTGLQTAAITLVGTTVGPG